MGFAMHNLYMGRCIAQFFGPLSCTDFIWAFEVQNFVHGMLQCIDCIGCCNAQFVWAGVLRGLHGLF